ncbi:MAG: tyrosine-type recombinase/integrase [Acidobacteria bacterium]|nr:tyrosine-type recombinase/integrase [Acidobacteriota bacterium]
MFTGMRVSEIQALRWIDIDFERRVIIVRRYVVSNYVTDATRGDEWAAMTFHLPELHSRTATLEIALRSDS